MASSESQEAEKSRIETSHAEFNALILRHKAMIWHICSDYRLGSAWNTEDSYGEASKVSRGAARKRLGCGALPPTPC